MYTKKILSVAAAAAIMSTGALAFDTNHSGEIIKLGGAAKASYNGINYQTANYDLNKSEDNKSGVSEKRVGNSDTDPDTIHRFGPAEIGDALIFPAFYAGGTTKDGKTSNWSSEFSIMNTSDEAVIAKVVLYGRINSVELRDFNVYLSAHDVFRAKMVNGRIISEDGSTVLPGSDKTTINRSFDEDRIETTWDGNAYKYTDESKMAGIEDTNTQEYEAFNIAVDSDEEKNTDGDYLGAGHGKNDAGDQDFEHAGYIGVYAMTQAVKKDYHKKHNELWQDYRHLLDTCRNNVLDNNGKIQEWRKGIQDGFYQRSSISLPNVDANLERCNTVYKSVLYGGEVKFKSPENVLSGSILISHDGEDGKGNRDMLLKAFALGNYTRENQELLWTEGEFANLADRCLSFQNGKAAYSKECVEAEADQLSLSATLYEFMDNNLENSRLLVTQPYKRVLVQLGDKDGSNDDGVVDAWFGVGSNLNNEATADYGQFAMDMRIYNDDEDNYVPQIGGFTVSPATSGTTSGIPFELSVFNPLENINEQDKEIFITNYPKGYIVINYENSLPGIVTQMAATVKDGKAETNWIYPLSRYEQ